MEPYKTIKNIQSNLISLIKTRLNPICILRMNYKFMLKKQDKLSIKRNAKNTGITIGRLLLDVPLKLIQMDKLEKNGQFANLDLV